MDFQGRSCLNLFEPLGEIVGRGIHFLVHDLLDGLVGHGEDILEFIAFLEDGVDQSIADDRIAPDPHIVFLLL